MSEQTAASTESDRLEITDLMFRYAELLNLCRIDEVAELFTHGKISSSLRDAVHEGPQAVADFYRSSVHFPEDPPDTLLFTTNIQLDIQGDEASGKAYFMTLHAASGALKPIIAGRYNDRFQRIDGRWWFAHRHMLVDLVGDVSSHVTATMEGDG